jgi:hypothetical protein
MKISHLRWLFVTSVVGFAGCAEQPRAAPRKEEQPGKVNVDVRDGVDVDVRRENGRKVDVDVKDGKVNVDVK